MASGRGQAEARFEINQKWGPQGSAVFKRTYAAEMAYSGSSRTARGAALGEVNGILIERHRKRAQILRADAAEKVQASVGTLSGRWRGDRRAQSTGFLAKITGAEANSLATITEVGIGRADFLDKQTARYGRYWRSFESGYSGSVGSPIRMPGKFKVNGKYTTLKALPATRGRTVDPSLRTVPWGPVLIKRPILAHGVYAELARSSAPVFRKELREDARIFLAGLTSNRRA